MRRFGWLSERGVLAGSSARLLPLEDVHRVSCSARILGASLRDRSGHFEELGAHATMRLLVAFGADEMFETLDRSKHEPRVGVSIPGQTPGGTTGRAHSPSPWRKWRRNRFLPQEEAKLWTGRTVLPAWCSCVLTISTSSTNRNPPNPHSSPDTHSRGVCVATCILLCGALYGSRRANAVPAGLVYRQGARPCCNRARAGHTFRRPAARHSYRNAHRRPP